jgi:hypothetical protein
MMIVLTSYWTEAYSASTSLLPRVGTVRYVPNARFSVRGEKENRKYMNPYEHILTPIIGGFCTSDEEQSPESRQPRKKDHRAKVRLPRYRQSITRILKLGYSRLQGILSTILGLEIGR